MYNQHLCGFKSPDSRAQDRVELEKRAELRGSEGAPMLYLRDFTLVTLADSLLQMENQLPLTAEVGTA